MTRRAADGRHRGTTGEHRRVDRALIAAVDDVLERINAMIDEWFSTTLNERFGVATSGPWR